MLKTRIITATILMAVLLPILFLLPPIYLSGFFLVALVAAAWEWSRMIAPEAKKAAWLYAVFCLVIILLLLGMQAITWQFSLLMMAVLFWFFIAPFILAKGMNLSLEKFKPFYSILGLIILPATWFALVFLRELGLVFLLSSMALVWVADIGAYFVGKAFGKHKLAPHISPGKTWEGVAGALLFTLLVFFALAYFLPPDSFNFYSLVFHRVGGWLGALVLMVLVALGIVGE